MAEHDADREPQPIDEEAAWAAIVAGYGEEPADPPGARPFRSVEDLALLEDGAADETRRAEHRPGAARPDKADPGQSLDGPSKAERRPAGRWAARSSSRPAWAAPRDYRRPSRPTTTCGRRRRRGPLRTAGAAAAARRPTSPRSSPGWRVIGGPVLLLLAVMFGWDMTWWLTTLGIGGFLGGFATLVARMEHDEDDDDPGRGAVV